VVVEKEGSPAARGREKIGKIKPRPPPPKYISEGVPEYSGYRLLLGDEGFADYFPFVWCEGLEVPICGENLGCADCGFFIANGSWREIAEIFQGEH